MLAVARTYAAMKQLEPALQYYRLANADADGLGEAERAAMQAEIAYIYADLGRLVEARENWIQAAALNDTPEIQMSLVYVESRLGMTTAALARLDALSRRGINGELHLAMLDQTALLHERSGNLTEAARYAELALAAEPTAKRHYHLALLASKAGKLQLTRSHLESAVDMDPNNNDYRQQLAYICNERGDTATAIRLFEELAGRDPTRTRLRQDIAYAYSKVADNGKAIEWFKKAMDEHLKTRLTQSSSQDPAQNLVDDDQETYALRQQVREMARRFQFNAYQSYRPNVRQQTSNVTPGFVAGGIIPSQGGVELIYQPAGIGYRDGRTFRVFGRALWSNKPESIAVDSKTTQGGVGIEYKPLRNVNAYLSLERLVKIGEQAEGNWLARASWGYSNGYDLRPNVRSWTQTILYADFGYLLRQDKIRSVYLETRQGRTINFNNTTLVTPHVTLVGRGQRPDPSRVSYLEAGAGVSLKYLFNETRYEAARSSSEFIVQYRRPVNNSKPPGGWVMTAVFQF
jgi:tetratricopeptide (TPR) repeat protein